MERACRQLSNGGFGMRIGARQVEELPAANLGVLLDFWLF
jgi:hypothetical protein